MDVDTKVPLVKKSHVVKSAAWMVIMQIDVDKGMNAIVRLLKLNLPKQSNVFYLRNEASDWYLNTGASAHMTPTKSFLNQSTSYTGKDCVIAGNGASLPITHTESPNGKSGGNR
ncbi:hypothetical protein ACP275_03G019000 [Erythranthe tilingii]